MESSPSHFSGRLPNTPIVVDSFQYVRKNENERAKRRKIGSRWKSSGASLELCEELVFFLSHAHVDHMNGLNSEWNHGRIYSTEITRDLVCLRYPTLRSVFIVLEIGTLDCISLSNGETFNVTAFDAHHCSGSCMFLFEGQFGRYLHTGDFRFNDEMVKTLDDNNLLYSADHPLDMLFLDTTFCFRETDQFPSREEVSSQAIDLIESVGGTAPVYLECSMLGTEFVLVDIARRFQSVVVVDHKIYNTIRVAEPSLLQYVTCIPELKASMNGKGQNDETSTSLSFPSESELTGKQDKLVHRDSSSLFSLGNGSVQMSSSSLELMSACCDRQSHSFRFFSVPHKFFSSILNPDNFNLRRGWGKSTLDSTDRKRDRDIDSSGSLDTSVCSRSGDSSLDCSISNGEQIAIRNGSENIQLLSLSEDPVSKSEMDNPVKRSASAHRLLLREVRENAVKSLSRSSSSSGMKNVGLFIKPSTQWFHFNKSNSGLGAFQAKPCLSDGIWHILLSCHSSFSELCAFVKMIQPRSIIPTTAHSTECLNFLKSLCHDYQTSARPRRSNLSSTKAQSRSDPALSMSSGMGYGFQHYSSRSTGNLGTGKPIVIDRSPTKSARALQRGNCNPQLVIPPPPPPPSTALLTLSNESSSTASSDSSENEEMMFDTTIRDVAQQVLYNSVLESLKLSRGQSNDEFNIKSPKKYSGTGVPAKQMTCDALSESTVQVMSDESQKAIDLNLDKPKSLKVASGSTAALCKSTERLTELQPAVLSINAESTRRTQLRKAESRRQLSSASRLITSSSKLLQHCMDDVDSLPSSPRKSADCFGRTSASERDAGAGDVIIRRTIHENIVKKLGCTSPDFCPSSMKSAVVGRDTELISPLASSDDDGHSSIVHADFGENSPLQGKFRTVSKQTDRQVASKAIVSRQTLSTNVPFREDSSCFQTSSQLPNCVNVIEEEDPLSISSGEENLLSSSLEIVISEHTKPDPEAPCDENSKKHSCVGKSNFSEKSPVVADCNNLRSTTGNGSAKELQSQSGNKTGQSVIDCRSFNSGQHGTNGEQQRQFPSQLNSMEKTTNFISCSEVTDVHSRSKQFLSTARRGHDSSSLSSPNLSEDEEDTLPSPRGVINGTQCNNLQKCELGVCNRDERPIPSKALGQKSPAKSNNRNNVIVRDCDDGECDREYLPTIVRPWSIDQSGFQDEGKEGERNSTIEVRQKMAKEAEIREVLEVLAKLKAKEGGKKRKRPSISRSQSHSYSPQRREDNFSLKPTDDDVVKNSDVLCKKRKIIARSSSQISDAHLRSLRYQNAESDNNSVSSFNSGYCDDSSNEGLSTPQLSD